MKAVPRSPRVPREFNRWNDCTLLGTWKGMDVYVRRNNSGGTYAFLGVGQELIKRVYTLGGPKKAFRLLKRKYEPRPPKFDREVEFLSRKLRKGMVH